MVSSPPLRSKLMTFLSLLSVVVSSGCSLTQAFIGMPTIRAHQLPPELLAIPRAGMKEISMERLRQDKPDAYRLDSGDVLGVFIENVLGKEDEAPPVHFTENGSLPPALGFPLPVREDGTVDLPLVPPVRAQGLTIPQITDSIRRAYTVDRKILPAGRDRILITLIRRREYRVLVVREESGSQDGVSKRGTGYAVDLPAYENDLLHALNKTGGMPGLDAKSEVLIYRGAFQDAEKRDLMLANFNEDEYGDFLNPAPPTDDPNLTRVPLRYHPERMPQFRQEDIVLHTGDIVVVQSRDRERFYTGGILRGGDHLIPRDYDLDVLGAIALAKGNIGSGGVVGPGGPGGIGGNGGGYGGGGGGFTGIAPTRIIVLRKIPGSQDQVAIRIDLNRALQNRRERILIKPEDMIMVQYTCEEQLANFALSAFRFNYNAGAGLGGR